MVFWFRMSTLWVLVFCCVIVSSIGASEDSMYTSFKDQKGKTVHLQINAVGCFADSKRRSLRNLYYDGRALINWTNTRYTIKKCAEIAYKEAFHSLFAVQFYGECWSDGSAEKRYRMYGASSNCEHGVGKDWTNMVYRYKVVKTTSVRST